MSHCEKLRQFRSRTRDLPPPLRAEAFRELATFEFGHVCGALDMYGRDLVRMLYGKDAPWSYDDFRIEDRKLPIPFEGSEESILLWHIVGIQEDGSPFRIELFISDESDAFGEGKRGCLAAAVRLMHNDGIVLTELKIWADDAMNREIMYQELRSNYPPEEFADTIRRDVKIDIEAGPGVSCLLERVAPEPPSA